MPRAENIAPPEEQANVSLSTVQLNSKPCPALLDTGCSQSLVQAQLVLRELWNEDETVCVICVHGHEERAPTAEVYIEVKNHSHKVLGKGAEQGPSP